MRISDWSSDVCSSDLCWKSAAEPGATPVVVGPVGVVVCSTGGAVSLGAGGSVSGRFLEQPATAMSAVPMMSVVVNLAMSILPRFGRYAPAPIAEAIALHRRCVNASGPQGSPRRVRSVARGRYFALVDAGQVDRSAEPRSELQSLMRISDA